MNIEELNLTDEQLEAVKKYGQSEADKVRTEYSQKLKTANEELDQYKPKEKSDSEKALDERISALEAREKAMADKERALNVAEKLKAKGIPAELAPFLNVGEDIDKTIESVGATLGNYFLDGTNKPTDHRTNKPITKEDFKKMSYSQRAKLFQEDNALYKILSK